MQQIAPSAGHTFICYARDDQDFVLKVAAGLRALGVPIWIDQWSIEPGADWNRTIDQALNACGHFLIVLSPAAVASDEVNSELRVALNSHKHIIPLLYRRCEIPRQLLLKHWLDFTMSPDVTEASLQDLARALRAEAPAEPKWKEEGSGRVTLLQDVRAEARDRLRSVSSDSPVPILLEPQPYQVARPWDEEDAGPASRHRPALPVTDIIDVFDDADGRLLILGPPGSGKTTLMLQLMQRLSERADVDARRLIPVLVSLASWRNEPTLTEWLVHEIKNKYGVRADLSRRWLHERHLALLLDGLDELPAEHQHPCVNAINAFEQGARPPCLIVCCRQAEYENLTVKLRLRAAVSLLPLGNDQIRDYLAQAGSANLWDAISGDPELLDMARSPLLLSFMSALPAEPDFQRWPDAPSATERRQRLFDAYLLSRASSETNAPLYTREQTLRWLRQLATMLKRQGQPDFLTERMQPDWLESTVQRSSYRFGVGVVSAAAVGLLFVALDSIAGMVPRGDVGLALQKWSLFSGASAEGRTLNQTAAFLIPIVVGCLIAFRKTIIPVETLTWSWSRSLKYMGRWAQTAFFAGLDYGIRLGAAASLIGLWMFGTSDATSQWERAGMWVGAIGSLLLVVCVAAISPSVWLQRERRPLTRQRIIDAVAAAVLYGLVSGSALFWDTERNQIVGLGLVVLLLSGSVFAVVAFSGAATDTFRTMLLKSLMGGVIGGATMGGLAAWTVRPSIALRSWCMCTAGGLAAGMILGVAVSLVPRVREWVRSTDTREANTGWTWKKSAISGVAIGLALGLAGAVPALMGNDRPVGQLIVFVWVGYGVLSLSLGVTFMAAAAVAIAGAVTAGILGALAGVLGGVTGAEVERRLVPNQGIRQSAVNIVVFAGLGVLIVGIPYGLVNLMAGSLAMRTLPSAGDWLRLGVGAGVAFGLLAGLLPGAACIQHFVLRFVLWASGILPLRCVRFLNFATRRRLIHRVGGRYRFIHVLLRDHLSDTARAHAAA